MEIKSIEKLNDVVKGRINGEIVDQVVTRLTASGENYLSLILKLVLKIRNGNKEETVQTVAKLVPPAFLNAGSFMFMSQATFKNEIIWYDVIVPILEKFEEEHDVQKLFTDIYPKFYGGRYSLDPEKDDIDKDAVVLLEYLEGYTNKDRLTGFDYMTSKEVIKALARFQAFSIALKLKKPEFFKQKVRPLLKGMPQPPEDNKFDFNPAEGVIDVIKECPECEAFVSRCEEVLKVHPFAVDNSKPIREPWATTVHNDFWVNNIMIKDVINDGKHSSQVKIVDFQGISYGSFAIDLAFLLLLSTQTKVLQSHCDEFLKFYYDVFIDYLKQLEVDTSQFTYDGYLKEFELEVKNGQFSHATSFTNVVFRERGTGPDVAFETDVENTFKSLMQGKTQKQKEKIWAITKVCGEKNWI